MSLLPDMKHERTSMLRPENTASSAAFRPLVSQRYHCRPPWKSRFVRTRRCTPGVLRRSAIGMPRSARAEGICDATVCAMSLSNGHHVVGGQLGEFRGGPAASGIGPVLLPVRALVVVVGAQERVYALRAILMSWFGFAGGVVPLVVLARRRLRPASPLRYSGATGRSSRPCRSGSCAGRRRGRSSGPPSGRCPAGRGRTTPQRATRSHAPPPQRPPGARGPRRSASRVPDDVQHAKGEKVAVVVGPSHPVVRP